MSHQVYWTRVILEAFLEESGIKDRIEMGDEKAILLDGIMRTRVANWSIVKQAQEFNVSVETINKYTRELKDLYDETEKMSFILPPRKRLTKWELSTKLYNNQEEED